MHARYPGTDPASRSGTCNGLIILIARADTMVEGGYEIQPGEGPAGNAER